MSKKSALRIWGLLVLLAWLPSCSSSSTCQGGEMCACYANDTCNDGLSCRSHTCVNLNDTTGGGAAGGASGSNIDTKACLACADKSCTSEASACKAASGCEASLSCFLNCGTDATCEANCANGLTTDSGAKAVSYYSCAVTQCVSDCVYVPGAGGSGNSGGSSATTGGTGNHGGSGTSLGGTSNSGGTSSDGGIGGGAPATELTTGTNWLTLVADGAPPDRGVNGKLNINGVLYAYGDGCATLNWDPGSRCLTGDLCVGSATNWGVAVGFDFSNSGAMGVPPDTKRAWNANTVAATGFAWMTMGSVPNGLQVWVLNMDPSFGGTCSVKSCDINGPPDGTANASSSGQFSFATMMKDDWGGTGTAYTFNPTDISALQFKIPAALDSIDTSYELCVEDIGVIR